MKSNPNNRFKNEIIELKPNDGVKNKLQIQNEII